MEARDVCQEPTHHLVHMKTFVTFLGCHQSETQGVLKQSQSRLRLLGVLGSCLLVNAQSVKQGDGHVMGLDASHPAIVHVCT